MPLSPGQGITARFPIQGNQKDSSQVAVKKSVKKAAKPAKSAKPAAKAKAPAKKTAAKKPVAKKAPARKTTPVKKMG